VIVSPADAAAAHKLLGEAGETVWRIGTVRRRQGDEAQTIVT
jgi:phosphoribosylformylglycinamidine cyclo-ligase